MGPRPPAHPVCLPFNFLAVSPTAPELTLLAAGPACQVRSERPPWHLSVICGTVLRALGRISSRSAEYLSYLEKGQLPPARISLTTLHEEFVVDGGWSWLSLPAFLRVCLVCKRGGTAGPALLVLHSTNSSTEHNVQASSTA